MCLISGAVLVLTIAPLKISSERAHIKLTNHFYCLSSETAENPRAGWYFSMAFELMTGKIMLPKAHQVQSHPNHQCLLHPQHSLSRFESILPLIKHIKPALCQVFPCMFLCSVRSSSAHNHVPALFHDRWVSVAFCIPCFGCTCSASTTTQSLSYDFLSIEFIYLY